MLLTAQLQLIVSEAENNTLSALIAACAGARQDILRIAGDAKVYRWLDINRLAYHQVKASSGLPANLVQSLIRQVAVELTKFKGTKEVLFRENAAIPLISRYVKPAGNDQLRFNAGGIWLRLAFACGETQRVLLNGKWREGKLQRRDDGKWFLHLACDVPAQESRPATDVLGVDLGIVSIATDSDGEVHTGADVQEKRRMFAHRRRNLQCNGSRAAKRKLRSIRRKQARYQAHVNHVISKRLVAKAFDTCSRIALEDLKGMRSRVKVRRRQRATLHNWGFGQLRFFVEYKARRLGIPVVTVDPRNTSRGCPACGHVSKSNRPSQAVFRCQSCGLSGPADSIAARNIRVRALADAPMVAASS